MRKRKFLKKIFFFGLIILLFSYFFVYQPIKNIRDKGMVLVASAKEVKQVFSQNDIDLLNKKLNQLSSQYQEFEKASGSIYWASFIPYIADFKNGVEAGKHLIKAVQESVGAISPYADLIGFKKGEISFVERSAEERLQTAVLTLDKVLVKIDPIASDIEKARDYLNKIDPNRYPKKYKEKIINIKEQFNGLASLFVDAQPLIKRLPEILGKNKEKTYLVLFQNDKELRATGGFLTSYSIFKVKDGKIKIEKSDDIYSLDATIKHPPAPREIITYHKDVSKFYIRDSNLSPDLPSSVELFNSLYKTSGAKVQYDGIIFLDSKVLVDMLTIFGDTEAGGVRFSSRIDKRCDCPQVIYVLSDIVGRPTPYIRENRKGILGELMHALFYKALGFSPSRYWGTLSQMVLKNLHEKHILLYFPDYDLQQSIEKLNFAGRIKEYSGDYLHINNVNFAGAKSNLFVSKSITSKTFTDKEGKIIREVIVDYRNPYPHSDCNLERGGLCLNATLRNWVRVFVPKGSQLLSFQGSEKKVQIYEDLDKTVFEGFLRVNPLGKAQIKIVYNLPSFIDKKNYRLLIQKQPGTDNQKLKVEVDNKKIYDGVLDTDKELKIK